MTIVMAKKINSNNKNDDNKKVTKKIIKIR